MSIKLKALLQLVGLTGLAVLVSVVIQYINANVSTETLTTALEFGLIGAVLYTGYKLLVIRLEIAETFNKVDK
jgi:TRAP-type C4-dicarboxylate transport system permease small subunit